ncbi:putative polyadenylate-binding protein 1 [Triplophysa rosa]|uniref:Polyadenylate-binding protein 1 n=1 Tax=Triplophysa rosa TaxID=992332 RepID=A0A9W7W8J8_TRIRA|nr:putative polyadenylate-binding protein 1 [Triplophysa rosa]
MFDLLMGRPMRIMWADRNPALRITGVGNIFIQGLAKNITSLTLHDTFSRFGTILSCKVVADENGSKGFGFVHYVTYEASERAIQTLNGMMLNDQLVSISHFRSFQERQSNPERAMKNYKSLFPGVHLYVNNLPYSWTDHQLHRAFSPFGTVTNAKVVRNGGRSKGFGFVCFASREAAAQAITAMNGRVIANRWLNVAFSRVKDQDTSVSDCESPSVVTQTLLPSGRFGSVVPQAKTGHQRTRHLQLESCCRRDAACLLSKCESLVSLVSPLLLDTLVSHTPVDALQRVNQELSELKSDPVIDAPGTSDTFSAVTSLLSGDFAVVPKTHSNAAQQFSSCLVFSRRWFADVALPQCESLVLLVSPLLSDTFDSETPHMLTVNQDQSEMTPDRATDAPGPSDGCSDVAVVHDRFGNGSGELRHMSSLKVMVVMDGVFVSVLCCSSDDTVTVIMRIQEDLLLYSEFLLFNTADQIVTSDTSSPLLAIQSVHPESESSSGSGEQIVSDKVQSSAQYTIKPVFSSLMETWASLHEASQTLHISPERESEVTVMTRADIQQVGSSRRTLWAPWLNKLSSCWRLRGVSCPTTNHLLSFCTLRRFQHE